MKHLVFLTLIIIVSVNTAYALPPPPPTSFIVTIEDETGTKIEAPAFVLVKEILDGEILQSYRIDLFKNPDTVPTLWYTPNTQENTEIHIVAAKQGFENSVEFVFTVTSNTPKEGVLFEHTFVLNTEETSKITDKDFQVTKSGKSYTINTSSSSIVKSISFIENENTLLIIVNEDSIGGTTNLEIPNSLISPPFQVFLDGGLIILTEEKSGSKTNLQIEYPNGVHSIRVGSPVDTTVPQTGQGIESEFEQQVEKPTEEVPVSQPSQEQGGGCLIATATYGSELAPQVQQLREIRDNSLLQTESGRSFIESFNQFYYSFSPGIADLEREKPIFKEVVKLAITPLLTSLSILNYVDMDSEAEVLGYGISLILLNVGMYFVAPALIIFRIFRIKE